MKKFFAALLVALFGAVPLFADDVADVKATFVRELELSKAGDFAGKLALYAPDYMCCIACRSVPCGTRM